MSENVKRSHGELLQRRKVLTEELSDGPLNPKVVLGRAEIYQELGYPDLAVADAYYGLTLVETAIDPEFSDLQPQRRDAGQDCDWPLDEGDIPKTMVWALETLVEGLTKLGCLKQALVYLLQLKAYEPTASSQVGQQIVEKLTRAITQRFSELQPNAAAIKTLDDLEGRRKQLPTVGLAPREVYTWDNFEPDRTSPESLGVINEELVASAPDLVARATFLPILAQLEQGHSTGTCLQLGLFAKKDLTPSQPILHERSIITAIRPIDASLCDLCASPLPDLSASSPPVACPDCSNAIFCSTSCLNFALEKYHRPPFCDNEDGLDEIGRDANAPFPADDLYFLLVARTIAMAEAQNIHPLQLFETEFLCGEFTAHSAPPSLPFTFTHNIILPFRFFTTLMLSSESITPYSKHWLYRYDAWIIQTLYAKFRGVASAQQSTWDAKPEVAAVHPLWCLANHSCAPNVTWKWGEGPEIVYTVREKPVWRREHGRRSSRGGGSMDEVYMGIQKDEEIMNHYVDVGLGVDERRAYAMGPLGGVCRCERCLVESGDM
jgi:hypothetical protein